VFLLFSVNHEFTNVPVSRFTDTLERPPSSAVTNGGAISEVDCVTIAHRESNLFSSESYSSRSLTVKTKCRDGEGTVEFVHILALLKGAAAKFRQLRLPYLPVGM
jgi:hypothetical protein